MSVSGEHLVQNANTNVMRQSANFHPSIWGDHFITYTPDDMLYDSCLEQVEELKIEVRRMLLANANESSKKLNLIDSIQRLGVAYHFEGEIDEALEQIHDSPYGFDYNDLHNVALRFRLLRQQGHNIPSDVFNRFKDNDGNFKEDLINDVNGMLCLYEATHLRVHGEDILDEALEFTTTRLNSIVTDLKPPLLATQVMHALKQPLHKNVPRLEAKHYISVYQENNKKNESLLKLAKLDFNLLRSIYLQELSQLSKWWKEVDFASKLPYSRDRLVECYFLSVAVYFEPHHARARKILTKFTVLLSVIDDTYDAYGTLEELKLFTDAIERSDLSPINQLPEYMKVVYATLLDVYNATEEELRKEGQSYRVDYVKEAMKVQARAGNIEAQWFNDGYIPTIEEYMQNGLITSAIIMTIFASFLGMGDVVTKEVFDWAMNVPEPLKASCLIFRLMNDMVSHKFEQERGRFCSAIECYIKQYDVSEKDAHDELNRRVVDAWKVINQACLKPTAVPIPVLLAVVNLNRIDHIMYKDKDGYTLAHEVMKELITSLLIDPIHM